MKMFSGIFWNKCGIKTAFNFCNFCLLLSLIKGQACLLLLKKKSILLKVFSPMLPLILILGWLLSFWGLMNVHVLQEQKVSKCSLDPGIFHSWCHCLNNYATQPWILWGVRTQLLICKNWNFMSYQKLRCCHKTKIRGSIDESYFRKAKIWRPTHLCMF